MPRTCPNCGYANVEGAGFCEICGAVLPTVAADPSDVLPVPFALPRSDATPPPPPPLPPSPQTAYAQPNMPQMGYVPPQEMPEFNPMRVGRFQRADMRWIAEAWNLITLDLGGWIGYGVVMLLLYTLVAAISGLAFMFLILTVFQAREPSAAHMVDSLPEFLRTVLLLPIVPIFGPLLLIVVGAASMALGTVLCTGVSSAVLRKLRYNDPLDLRQTFADGWSRFGTTLLYALVIGTAYSLLSGAISSFCPPVSMVLAFIFMPPFYLGFFRIADGAPDFWSAWTDCWAATSADWMGYGLLALVISIMQTIGMCACGVGYFVALPVSVVAMALAYRGIFDVDELQRQQHS